jgi:hypothetical protein
MLKTTMKHLRFSKRGISNVIVVMLSLVLLVIVVANVVLWSYQMNQLDWERMREGIAITDLCARAGGTLFAFKNTGSLTSHIVAVWVNNATRHYRYEKNVFINSGDNASYTWSDINLPNKPYNVKVVTERGNTAIFSVR